MWKAKVVLAGFFIIGSTAFAAGASSRAKIGVRVFTVKVDYSLSLDTMIDAGRYNCSNDDVPKYLPVQGEGAGVVRLRLLYFGKEMSTELVLAELEKHGLKSATLAEVLAFGAKYPKIQRQFPVVTIGPVNLDSSRYMAILRKLGSHPDWRCLFLGTVESGRNVWSGETRFLVVSK